MSRYELKVSGAAILRSAPNFSTPSLRPPDSFPVSFSRDGLALSKFSDACWDLSAYSDRPIRLWFGDKSLQNNSVSIDQKNARTQRYATFHFLYGERPQITAATVAAYHESLKKLFAFCSSKGVLADQLGRYPHVVKEFAKTVSGGAGRVLILVLRELAAHENSIGFCILNSKQLDELQNRIPRHEPTQYAYIPRRLYGHLLSRTTAFLEDYLEHQEQIESLFRDCLDAYIRAYGSIDAFNAASSRWRSNPTAGRRSPFGYLAKRSGTAFLSFADTVRLHGAEKILGRWLLEEGRALESVDISSFSRYLTGVTFVGQVQIAALTGMRVSETASLRSKCFEVDIDPLFGRAYLIRGETKKTQRDQNALWVTAKSAQCAVHAMTSVAKLRLGAAAHDSRTSVTLDDFLNPQLIVRAYEPWSPSKEAGAQMDRLVIPSLGDWRGRLPTLLDKDTIRITNGDFDEAVRMTPSIDVEKFAVGREWDFSFHQLRRTLVCNAASSDLVSMPSLSAQLKHATVGQTWHYGSNYSALKLNESVGRAYEEAIVDTLTVRGSDMPEQGYVSPLGRESGERLLTLLGSRELSDLKRMARKGQFSIRETALGVCMRAAPCPYGGWEHLGECLSCPDALFSKQKAGQLRDLRARIEQELCLCGDRDSAKKAAYKHQHEAAGRALEIICVD